MTDSNNDDFGLDAHFAAAKGRAVQPSPDLLARVLGDAGAVQADWAATPYALASAPAPSGGYFAQLLAVIGGWPAVAGLAAAGIAGLWIGVAGPAMVGETMASYLGSEGDAYLVDLVPAYDFELSEG